MSSPARPVKELHGPEGATHAALYAPHADLSGCVRAYLSRRTTAAAALNDEQRCNHFPPTPTCVFVWVVRGHDSRLPAGPPVPHDGTAALPVLFSGPHTRCSVSRNDGPVHFFTLLMYPDAVRSLTGLAIEPHLDRYSDFCSLFDADWQALARAVLLAADDAARIGLIEDFLRPRWAAPACGPAHPAARTAGAVGEPVHRIDHWSAGVARHAARQGDPLSERQADRRIKRWTGQNLRHLRALGRMESALLGVNTAAASPGAGWAALAAETGFSDQAHLCREFRRHLGLRPGELRRRLQDESAWVYRIWS